MNDDNLYKSLQLLINSEINIVLDKVSEVYNINRDELSNLLLGNIVSPDSSESKCAGLTKKGQKCTNKAKPNSNYCGRHDIIS
jgi:hypothetical protein